MKKLKDPAGPLEKFFSRARELGPRLGPVLYQLPPRWNCDVERLRRFVAELPFGVRHAIEFRDPSWYNDAVREVLAGAGVGFCIHDMRGSASPLWATGPLVYVRLHGPTELKYAGSYSRAALDGWAERINEFRDTGRDVYAYFNNDDRGHAVTNARTLRELLGEPLGVAAR
jgi:uncharacterized protein YecE (DUF72 family)